VNVDDAADVLIIGAGGSGAVAALRLVESGYRVVCLEQGDWPDRESFRGNEPDWELAARGRWSGVPAVRRAPADYPIDLSESDVGVLNFNGVGGGTVLYGAQWPRMLPSDFAMRSSFGAADDWPLTYAELEPWYDRVDRQFGVSGLGGNPAYPPGRDPPLPPLPIGAAGLLVARAHCRLGWHWWPDSNAILSAPFDGRRPCVQMATCLIGCREGAKASTDLTHWARIVAQGGRLITGAGVRRLLVDRRSRVTGAEWIDVDGAAHVQAADVTLLAANGIGTPRLLLASASPLHRDGIANRSGLVGRNLMMHPLGAVRGVFDADLESWRGQNGGAIVSLEFYRSDERRGFVGGAKWSLSPAGGPLRSALTGGATWGPRHHAHVRARLGHSAIWGLVCEDLPEPTNRVVLSPDVTDRFGLPGAKLLYRIPENTHRLFDWHVARARESFEAAGAAEVELEARYPPNGHFMGSARMGDDPDASVVDRWNRAHDVPNLGIIDGSAFVTGGGVNPTSTICALALRAVDHLVEHRAEVPTPVRTRSFPVGRPVRPPDRVARGGRPSPAAFGPVERERLSSLAAALIPAGDGMPSAGDVDVPGRLLDDVLAAVPNIAADLHRALATPVGEPPRRLDALRADDRTAYHALTLAVAGGYYLDERVRSLLRYPGQVPMTLNSRDYPEYVAEGLIDQVLANWAARGDSGPPAPPRRPRSRTSSPAPRPA
jgi:choline dehydrogenase-like flavoprotein